MAYNKAPINFKTKFLDDILNLPWFNESFPSINSVVIVRVGKFDEILYKCQILNYGSIEAILPTSEVIKKKNQPIARILKPDEIKPMIVTSSSYSIEKSTDPLKSDTCVISVSLSIKQLTSSIDKVNDIERYYTLLLIIYNWIKNMYKSSIHNSQYLLDPSEEKTSDPSEEKALDLSEEKTLQLHDTTCIYKKWKVDIYVWNYYMERTLWMSNINGDNLAINEIYDLFVKIKMKEKTIIETFPGLLISQADLPTDILMPDLDEFNKLINKFIPYNGQIVIKLTLKCWSLNTIIKIQSILTEIQNLELSYNFKFDHITINPPYYEFIIKSDDKTTMDRLFVNNDESSEFLFMFW
jgi:hypothetical protein